MIIVLILGILLCFELRKPKARKPLEAKRDLGLISSAILIIFVAIYSLALFNIIDMILPQLKFIVFWPDALAYIWVNFHLALYWWKSKGEIESNVKKLSLAADVMGGTVKAGIVATSILIPLCITAIELELVSERHIIPLPSLRHLIIAVSWFGLSIMLGLINLGYINELIGGNINILKERKVGIPTNLQLYAIFMGIFRILWVLYILWSVYING